MPVLYYFLLKPLSLLPLSVLHVLSDFLFLVIYYLVGYRKKVVFKNLHSSFPEKNEQEIKSIARGYYRHLCDYIVEGIRLFSMPKAEALRRVKMLNPEVPDRIAAQGRGVIFVTGHYADWEMGSVALDPQLRHKLCIIAAPIKNKFLDKKINAYRRRCGAKIVSRQEIVSFMRKTGTEVNATVFLGDQAPPNNHGNYYWTNFLNQETPVVLGAEMFAKRYNLPVIYIKQKRVKRGYYTMEAVLLTENPQETERYEITEMHTRLLEEMIREEPQYWLWSHRRWKRKKPE